MKFPGKMCLKIILNVTKNQDSNLSLEDTFFEKLRGKGGGRVKSTPPPSRFMVKMKQEDVSQGVY